MIKFFTLLLSLSLVACGQTRTEKSETESDNGVSVELKNTVVEPESKDFEKLGFDLMKNETLGKLKLGLQQSDIIDILGEPNIKTKNELWGADGEYHQSFNYSNLGIELDIIGEKEAEQRVNMITIINPCNYKTSKGISIGSNYKEVKETYGDYFNPDFSNKEFLVAGSIYGGVIFYFENGKVKSIFIGAEAE